MQLINFKPKSEPVNLIFWASGKAERLYFIKALEYYSGREVIRSWNQNGTDFIILEGIIKNADKRR